jgi:hypothetical protein
MAQLGCAAGAVRGARFETDHFRFTHPGEGWRVVSNHRWGPERLVGLRHDDQVDIRVREFGITAAQRRIPLLILSQALFSTYGRQRGLKGEVSQVLRIDVGDHEGIAILGTRSNGVVTRSLSQVYLRAEQQLLIISYIGPDAAYQKHVEAFNTVLKDFQLALRPDPPEIGLPAPQ